MPSEIKLLTVNDSDAWESYLDLFPDTDIYYHYDFLKNFVKNSNSEINNSFCGQGYLLVYSDINGLVINPTIKRKIADLEYFKGIDEYKPYFDLISPYGYSGPIFLPSKDNLSKLRREYFVNTFTFFKEQNIVSEFIRFNPIIDNHKFFKGKYKAEVNSRIVAVNLRQELEVILSKMNKKTRNQIRRSKSKGVSVSIKNDKTSIEMFSKIYSETMKYNSASRKYDFDSSFFMDNFKNLKDKINLFVAELDGKIISGSLFINHNNSIHYYFSGTISDYRTFYPNNLIIWEAVKWGKSVGFSNLNLGGGRTSSNTDALFKFKKGFSDVVKDFYTIGLIYNNRMYNNLKDTKQKFFYQNEDSGFFPEYRQ